MTSEAMMTSNDDTGLDIRAISIDKIEENDWNPNAMEMELFNTLVEQVEAEGMIQPVLVIAKPNTLDEYIVVDGAHRYRAAKMAGMEKIAVVVMDYSPDMAKFRTISMNRIRGQYIPLKMAKLLASLQESYTPTEIRRMTGIQEDEFKSIASLLEMPEINFDDAPTISMDKVSPPIQITLLLMPEEYTDFEAAMIKAMNFGGDKVIALVGGDVGQYDKAMTGIMGLSGTKLRNVALTALCRVFNALPKDQQKALYEEVIDKALEGKVA